MAGLEHLGTLLLLFSAVAVLHSAITFHYKLPRELETIDHQTQQIQTALNQTDSGSISYQSSKRTRAEQSLEAKRKHLTEQIKVAEQDARILIEGLKSLTDKKLIKTPEDLPQVLKDALLPQDADPTLRFNVSTDGRNLTERGLSAVVDKVYQWRRFDGTAVESSNKGAGKMKSMIEKLEKEKAALIKQKEDLKRAEEKRIREKMLQAIDNPEPAQMPVTDHSGKHKLLETSDDQFLQTPLSHFVNEANYGNGGETVTKGLSKTPDGTCEKDYGATLVKNWKAAAEEWCSPSKFTEKQSADFGLTGHDVSLGTKIVCHPYTQTGHTATDNLCTFENVVVSFRVTYTRSWLHSSFRVKTVVEDPCLCELVFKQALGDANLVKETMDKYVKSKHMEQPYPPWPVGTIKGACQKTEKWDDKKLPTWYKTVMSSVESILPPPPPSPPPPPPPSPPPSPPPAPKSAEKPKEPATAEKSKDPGSSKEPAKLAGTNQAREELKKDAKVVNPSAEASKGDGANKPDGKNAAGGQSGGAAKEDGKLATGVDSNDGSNSPSKTGNGGGSKEHDSKDLTKLADAKKGSDATAKVVSGTKGSDQPKNSNSEKSAAPDKAGVQVKGGDSKVVHGDEQKRTAADERKLDKAPAEKVATASSGSSNPSNPPSIPPSIPSKASDGPVGGSAAASVSSANIGSGSDGSKSASKSAPAANSQAAKAPDVASPAVAADSKPVQQRQEPAPSPSPAVSGSSGGEKPVPKGRRLLHQAEDSSWDAVQTDSAVMVEAQHGRSTGLGTGSGSRMLLDSKQAWWKPLECDEHIDWHALWVQRDTFANFFHDSEDFFNVFLTMAILDVKVADVRTIIMDLFPKGPFWDMWAKVFSSSGKEVMSSWDIKNKFGDKKVCFKKMTVAIIGPASPFTIHSSVTPCAGSPLMKAYSDFVIRGLRLHPFSSVVQKAPSKLVIVTWMARRPSVEWPEKHFCNEEFFTCNYFSHLGIRQIGRVLKNEEDAVNKLAELETRKYDDDRQVVFRPKDYNLLSLEEQIKVDMRTDVMVGPHGAGLWHSIFMPDRAHLVELSIDGSGGLKHFNNAAIWRRKKELYTQFKDAKNPVDVNKLFELVSEAAAKIDIKSH